MDRFTVLAQMSGTSLDGMDLALCEFIHKEGEWKYHLIDATTLPYSQEWKEKLIQMPDMPARLFWKTHVEYGHLIGQNMNVFLQNAKVKPGIIASHGHTVFHQPSEGYTMQAGSGEAIVAETGMTVVCDFRSGDVALGGQGAPLVPLGDQLLFPQYAACLNIGGFSNVSTDLNGQRIAFDICPSNIILNYLSERLGHEYDHNGEIGRNGDTSQDLFIKLNKLDYYSQLPPKTLGREWLEMKFLPVIMENDMNVKDMLRTCYEHIGYQISKALELVQKNEILVTGGGAHNGFLMEIIRNRSKHSFTIPEKKIVDYKEALVFAFLGLLRILGKNNILASVTGSSFDHSGGAVYGPLSPGTGK